MLVLTVKTVQWPLSTVYRPLTTPQRGCASPRTFDPERIQARRLFVVETVLDKAVDSAAAGAAAQARPQFCKIFGSAGSDDFHIAILSIAHPSAQIEFAGFAMNEPAESHALHAPLNQKMENHRCEPLSVFQMRFLHATRRTQLNPVKHKGLRIGGSLLHLQNLSRIATAY